MDLSVDLDLLKEIRDILVEQDKTLAVAESVTSGLIQFSLASAPNASEYFQGGITAYNLGQKCRHLSIDAIHGMKCDCISEKTAREMALNVIPLFACDYGIAITGYSALSKKDNINELYAWFAIAEAGKILLSKKIKSVEDEGDDTQLFYTKQTILAFRDILQKVESKNSMER